MKIALITPSNMIHMPYVKLYTDILINQNMEYDIFNWDRCHLETLSDKRYRDEKAGIRKNLVQYFGYAKFIQRQLRATEYDLVIVFGLQMLFFLQSSLYQLYKGKFLIDIRDKNGIIKFINMKRAAAFSKKIILSSPGFKAWLPADEYLISHNIKTNDLDSLIKEEQAIVWKKEAPTEILTIGTIRDYEINQKLINQLKNNDQFQLEYQGDGFVVGKLKEVAKQNHIKNIFFEGRYLPEAEKEIVQKADIISVLMYGDSENNLTLLPNRLYAAVFNFKPLLAYQGTYTGKIIRKYNLGLVIENFDDLDQQIISYQKNFDNEKYLEGRKKFLKLVKEENNQFQNFLVTSFNS